MRIFDAKEQEIIADKIRVKLFPRISELELFTILMAPVAFLLVQPEMLKKFVLIAELKDVRAYIGVGLWSVFIILLFGVSINLILRRKQLGDSSKFILLLIYHYVLFALGMAAATQAWSSFAGNLSISIIDMINMLVIAWFFSVSAVQAVIMVSQNRTPKTFAKWAKVIDDYQYPPLILVSMIVVQAVLLLVLVRNYPGLTSLYLTITYTRVIYRIIDKLLPLPISSRK